MNIGQRIRIRRKELDISVEELANRLNKNRATVYRYENGDIHNLPIDILEPLSDALETTPQYLLGWITSEAKNEKDIELNQKASRWYEEFGNSNLTDEEYEKVIEYTKFLLSQRKE